MSETLAIKGKVSVSECQTPYAAKIDKWKIRGDPKVPMPDLLLSIWASLIFHGHLPPICHHLTVTRDRMICDPVFRGDRNQSKRQLALALDKDPNISWQEVCVDCRLKDMMSRVWVG